jgi:hypothetical protein
MSQHYMSSKAQTTANNKEKKKEKKGKENNIQGTVWQSKKKRNSDSLGFELG